MLYQINTMGSINSNMIQKNTASIYTYATLFVLKEIKISEDKVLSNEMNKIFFVHSSLLIRQEVILRE